MPDKNVLFSNTELLPSAKVLCIGDVMIDKFIYGSIDRISPEAPIPVLLVEREKSMLGGAGNVVANIAALGAKATLAAVTGSDSSGEEVQKQLKILNINSAIEISPERSTTLKSRYICGMQQVLRVDQEKAAAVPSAIEDKIISRITALIPACGAVILSDYKKGLLTDKIISSTIAVARQHGKPVIVDPKRADFTCYRGATILKPNRKELEVASGMKAGTDDEVRAAALKIIMSCDVETILVTRGKDGLSIITKNAEPIHIPAQVREIYDVSGAGDTVIATFATAIAAGLPVHNAALLANIAAGIVVGKTGTATARLDEIRVALETVPLAEKNTATQRAPKWVTLPDAVAQADRLKARGLKVGFTNGCFDLLHPGHLSVLRQSRAACDFLIVAINSDASVKRLKGPQRPVQNQAARADILSALDMVDMVLVFEEDTPLSLIKEIKPDFLIKGGQYKLEEVVGYDIVTAYGGKIVRAEMEEGFSTTNTIARIK